jgi:hypothetical protein
MIIIDDLDPIGNLDLGLDPTGNFNPTGNLASFRVTCFRKGESN